MKQKIKAVEDFHNAFGQMVNTTPQLVDEKTYSLRYELMQEENSEYLEACQNNDLVEVVDALTDKLYILCGTIITHGMQDIIEKCFEEVQRSNMSKLDDNGKAIINGENGVFDENRAMGKVLKSKNFFEPNLKQFL